MDYLDELLQAGPSVKMRRAMLPYAEEVRVYERVTKQSLGLNGKAPGSAPLDQQDLQRQLILHKQHQLATTHKELLLVRTTAQQVAAENDLIAEQIRRIQERLEHEALVLRADLVNEEELYEEGEEEFDYE
eukprot:GILK01025301.1.p1 GENE.GILK01025301.1~~GILK01025301.1.p1  ORF type:complete len:153 (+),score=24.54 GILK01025301.1:67-459(+)